MKLKFGIAAILLSTLGLTGLIYVIIEKVDQGPGSEARKKAPIDDEGIFNRSRTPKPLNPPKNALLKAPAPTAPGRQDEKLIKELAKLSDADLAREHDLLSKRLKNENLMVGLEQKRLGAKEAAQARVLIERFTLLSLEGTRRQYLAVEPELKDAVFAHRDSLKDIRKTLSRY